jgi:anaerobic dimethyl sulfoxide reductase subunit C (anchor subunit)
MQWRKIGSQTLRTAIAWIATLIGLFFVYAMAQVYMMRTVPTWDTWYTPASFFTTTFLLGAVAVGAAFVASYTYLARKDAEEAAAQSEVLRTSLFWIAAASVVMLGVQFVIIPTYLAYQFAGEVSAITAIRQTFTEYGAIFVLRLILVFVGAGLLAVALMRAALRSENISTLAALAYTAFALVLVSEVLGRFLFYASYTRMGL